MLFNFSDIYCAQGFLPWLQAQTQCSVVDLRDVEGCCCYCDAEARGLIEARLPAALPSLRWLDSGDYHYLSCLLAGKETKPFHLLLLDNHPDNQEASFGGILSCGGWVKTLSDECPQLQSVLTIGPEGCPRDIPEEWLEARRGARVYVSLDKDILQRQYARTDWSQGNYSLEAVKEMLERLFAAGVEIAAVDICGEVQESKGATPEDLRINLETNIELYNFINNHLN